MFYYLVFICKDKTLLAANSSWEEVQNQRYFLPKPIQPLKFQEIESEIHERSTNVAEFDVFCEYRSSHQRTRRVSASRSRCSCIRRSLRDDPRRDGGTYLRRGLKNEKLLPRNFRRLVLSCIEADFSNLRSSRHRRGQLAEICSVLAWTFRAGRPAPGPGRRPPAWARPPASEDPTEGELFSSVLAFRSLCCSFFPCADASKYERW